jgi:hypothetical protein
MPARDIHLGEMYAKRRVPVGDTCLQEMHAYIDACENACERYLPARDACIS